MECKILHHFPTPREKECRVIDRRDSLSARLACGVLLTLSRWILALRLFVSKARMVRAREPSPGPIAPGSTPNPRPTPSWEPQVTR